MTWTRPRQITKTKPVKMISDVRKCMSSMTTEVLRQDHWTMVSPDTNVRSIHRRARDGIAPEASAINTKVLFASASNWRMLT
jgi:hypothetical protein